MKFLSILGQIVKIIGVVTGLIPLVEPSLPSTAQGTIAKVDDKLTKIMNVIVTTEQIFAAAFGSGAKLGSDKLKASVPFVAQIIQQSDLLIGKKVKNESLFTDACTRLTAAIADILNSIGQ